VSDEAPVIILEIFPVGSVSKVVGVDVMREAFSRIVQLCVVSGGVTVVE
jgi:hypothetical protein